MNLAALQHLIRSAHALAEEVSLLVLGSAPLLASFPELGDPQVLLKMNILHDLLWNPTVEALNHCVGQLATPRQRMRFESDSGHCLVGTKA